MCIDFEENELLALFDEYRDRYSLLESSVERQSLAPQYGTVSTIPRGYYCPSLVMDILIGGAKRGKVSAKPSKAETAPFVFWFDKEDKLIAVESFSVFPSTGRVITGREYLIYHGPSVIAPEYSVSRMQKSPLLRRITRCEYDDLGRIRKYRTLFSSDLECGRDRIDSFEIYAEDYRYDPESDLLDTVQYGQCRAIPTSLMGDSIARQLTDEQEQVKLNWESVCRFIHDENGFVIQYKESERTDGDPSEVLRTVPKYKRRII